METAKLQMEMDRIKDESETLASEYTVEKQRIEMRIQKLAEERDRAKAECRKLKGGFKRRLNMLRPSEGNWSSKFKIWKRRLMTMTIVDQMGAPCSRIRRMSIESLLFA